MVVGRQVVWTVENLKSLARTIDCVVETIPNLQSISSVAAELGTEILVRFLIIWLLALV